MGVLLVGDPAVGKSELALDLITRGHRLIADDAPRFARIAPETLEGTCPETLRDFLEVRGLGILNIRAMFGEGAVLRSKTLNLIIDLQPLDRAAARLHRPAHRQPDGDQYSGRGGAQDHHAGGTRSQSGDPGRGGRAASDPADPRL